MKSLVYITLIGAAILGYMVYVDQPSVGIENEFRAFIDEYKVGYGSTDEYSYRLRVFEENMKLAAELNEANPFAEFGVTIFADRTEEEMNKMKGFIEISEDHMTEEVPLNATPSPINIDYSQMWDKRVKNQGSCGSCWAFSAIGAFESRYAISKGKTKIETEFSEQQLVDCVTKCSGCNGGNLNDAFVYLLSKPICQMHEYPYTGFETICKEITCRNGPKAINGYSIISKIESDVIERLKQGPLSVAVDTKTWHLYKGGVFTNCGKVVDHAVLLVGANTSANPPYVIVRNSWGSQWGEKGYIKLGYGNNVCGYVNQAYYPTF